MGDATSLRTLLSRVDATAPAIQSTAGAMMKHYDRSAGVAVVEWRNALHNSNHRDQWLPLLYVANEVLQNSKRNRGNKFLEAFSPILGQSLIYVCQHSDAATVEKVRRTCKIWAERHVFSVRFVNELLKGLEPYRNNRGDTAPPTLQQQQQQQQQFASPSSPPVAGSASAVTTTPSPHNNNNNNHPNQAAASGLSADQPGNEEDDEDDPMDIFNTDDNEPNGSNDGDDDDDDDDVFGNSGSGALNLDVELDFEQQGAAAAAGGGVSRRTSGIKRRRSSTASTGSQSSATKRSSRRKSVLSTSALMELWKQVNSLEQSYDHSMARIKDINLPAPEHVEALVGDELLEHYKTMLKYEERVASERQNLHRIATERRALEVQAVRYIPWLEAALVQDQDDIDFCQKLISTLTKFQHIHPAIRDARDRRVAEDLRYQREQEEKERKRKEEEESKRFRESALSKETEAKPGMVWNKVTQEYQYLNTDESWRD